MRRISPSIAAVAVSSLLSIVAFPRDAHAEPTTWLSLGGGYGFQRDNALAVPYDARATAFTLGLGAGTSPNHPFVFGGIFRTTTFFTLGTDLSLSARAATGGFARGDWGVAIDLGVVGRWWKGQDYGHFPVQAAIVGGLPFGFQIDVGATFADVSGDKPAAAGGFALLEIDFLRLTVNRSGSTTHQWPNPSPANGPRAPDAPEIPGEEAPGR